LRNRLLGISKRRRIRRLVLSSLLKALDAVLGDRLTVLYVTSSSALASIYTEEPHVLFSPFSSCRSGLLEYYLETTFS
jgi:hypothetical protein